MRLVHLEYLGRTKSGSFYFQFYDYYYYFCMGGRANIGETT